MSGDMLFLRTPGQAFAWVMRMIGVGDCRICSALIKQAVGHNEQAVSKKTYFGILRVICEQAIEASQRRTRTVR